MSTNNLQENGKSISVEHGSLFDLHSIIDDGGVRQKPIMLKLSPGTDDYKIVMDVKRRLKAVPPTKVIRVLMRMGYQVYKRSIEREVE